MDIMAIIGIETQGITGNNDGCNSDSKKISEW